MPELLERIHPALGLRPIRDEDLPFLLRLYATTRADEMALAAWSEEQKSAFLRMQFDAQHRHYTGQFPSARFDLIELGGQPAGRLYVDRREDEIRVVDVALLPEHRGRGIGSGLMGMLLDEAREAALPVTLHVESRNPARRLYERLGFVTQESDGVYDFMRWEARPEQG